MPIVTFHLAEQSCSEADAAQLITDASELYSRVLSAPMERVRVFINYYPANALGVAGKPLTSGHKGAPFFEAIVLSGRPKEQRHELMLGFSRLVAAALSVEQSVVRGRIIQIDPDDWSIGGIPAAEMRKQEIADRAAAAATN